jgi:hypothetical protein
MLRSRILLIGACWLLCGSAAGSTEAEFEQDFTGATLRVDYYHTGTAGEEHFALERLRIEGPWPGSRTRPIDTSNLGAYLVEVADLATNRLLYSRGFSSIYGEWETTAEANRGTWGAIPESVRVPEPRGPFQLRIKKRAVDRSFREVWVTTVDPGSRFVDRAPLRQGDSWALIDNGEPSVKVDLVLLGEGYTEGERERFAADARRLVGALFDHEPFASRRDDFNVRAVHTPASRSGITRPRAGVYRDSPLGARYNTFDSERYVLTLNDRAWRDRAALVPYEFVIILVNERKYGGGGIFNTYCTAAAGSSFSPYLVVHEFGHHFAALGDEYYTSDVAYETPQEPRAEPWEPNITALSDPDRLKWRDLLSEATPLPTPWAKEEFEQRSKGFQQRRRELREQGAEEDRLEQLFEEEREQLSELLGTDVHAGRVGAFEGAMYEARGLYRPTVDCIMFTRDRVGFCPVCRRAIERVIDLYAR